MFSRRLQTWNTKSFCSSLHCLSEQWNSVSVTASVTKTGRNRRRGPTDISQFARYCVMFGQTSLNQWCEILIFDQVESPSTASLNSATSRQPIWSAEATPGEPASHCVASVNWVKREKKKKKSRDGGEKGRLMRNRRRKMDMVSVQYFRDWTWKHDKDLMKICKTSKRLLHFKFEKTKQKHN